MTQKTDRSETSVLAKVVLTPQEEAALQAQLKQSVTFIGEQETAERKSRLRVGRHLLETYYGGNIANVKSKAPRKGFSLRLLANQPGMTLSRSALHTNLTIAVVTAQLSGFKRRNALSAGHRLALAKVEDASQQLEDAQRIVKEKLSVSTFNTILMERMFGGDDKRPTMYAQFKAQYQVTHKALSRLTPQLISSIRGTKQDRVVEHLKAMRAMINTLIKAAEGKPAGQTATATKRQVKQPAKARRKKGAKVIRMKDRRTG